MCCNDNKAKISQSRRAIHSRIHYLSGNYTFGGVRLAKNDFGRFSVRFRFYKINCCFFGSFFCTVCCLMCMHSTECFSVTVLSLFLFVSVSHTIANNDHLKKNTLTVDPIMLEDDLCIRQCEKLSPNHRSRFFENRTVFVF